MFGPVAERSTIALDPNRHSSVPLATASEDHECKVLRASQVHLVSPMERNREYRNPCRRVDSAPDPRDNARIPRSGRRALFLNCTPQNVWIGTLGTAQNAVIFTTRPSKIVPGRLSSVCFEVQLRWGNLR